jgi:hypothetical protein
MKKILVLLMLIVSIGIKAQVYVLEYTKYVLHDIVKKKQYEEVPVKANVYFDISKECIYIIGDGKKIFEVTVLNTHQKGENMWYECIDPKTKTVWDVYTVDTIGRGCHKENILQAKSKESEFWLKKPIKCNK